ncbi:hypothetical protein [Saccharopolyspora hattusasensis]|uniref:hypothetical protein n=1 Tax=Saccharopolyspora hattusasensis TaxID=1128679 RepID=UPI003D99D01D
MQKTAPTPPAYPIAWVDDAVRLLRGNAGFSSGGVGGVVFLATSHRTRQTRFDVRDQCRADGGLPAFEAPRSS